MFRRGHGVANPLVPLLLTGSPSHTDNAVCPTDRGMASVNIFISTFKAPDTKQVGHIWGHCTHIQWSAVPIINQSEVIPEEYTRKVWKINIKRYSSRSYHSQLCFCMDGRFHNTIFIAPVQKIKQWECDINNKCVLIACIPFITLCFKVRLPYGKFYNHPDLPSSPSHCGWLYLIPVVHYRPLTRYVKFWVAHVPDCRERFPHRRGLGIPTCITARASRTCCDACRDR